MFEQLVRQLDTTHSSTEELAALLARLSGRDPQSIDSELRRHLATRAAFLLLGAVASYRPSGPPEMMSRMAT